MACTKVKLSNNAVWFVLIWLANFAIAGILLHPAEVPELPGCLTEAYSMDEPKRNLPEAVECWLGGATIRIV